MWTKEEAVEHVLTDCLPLTEKRKGKQFILATDKTETWEHGWVFWLVPKEGKGYVTRYLVDKRYKMTMLVATWGVDRTIKEHLQCVEKRKELGLLEEND